MIDFDKFYDDYFPEDLKSTFEKYFATINGSQFMSSIQKLYIAQSFVAGYASCLKSIHKIKS